MDSVNKAEILKKWLTEVGKTREELGRELGGVSKRTVDNWCSGRPIPDLMWGKIRGLMNTPPLAYRSVVAVPVRFTASEWVDVQRKLPPGADVEVYLRDLLLTAQPSVAAAEKVYVSPKVARPAVATRAETAAQEALAKVTVKAAKARGIVMKQKQKDKQINIVDISMRTRPDFDL